MGLILDSSLLIASERRGQRVWDILESVRASQGETESALSAITVIELTHGIYRANSESTLGAAGPLLKKCFRQFRFRL